ncbi:MAG: DUF4079 domain-containing protein [Cyanobacteria bacterium P01_A01_bin.3]
MKDLISNALLVHPIIAMLFVFPLVGIVTHYSWQTRQRRLATAKKEKSKIPPSVGVEHVKIGRWLASGVFGVAIWGLVRPSLKYLFAADQWPVLESVAVALFTIAAIVSFALLLRAKTSLWRGIFTGFTALWFMLLSFQDSVLGREGGGAIFERTDQWYVSHFYFGIVVAMLMVFSVAIQPEIYRDKTHKWRNLHILLNCLALALFIAQGITGARDIYEIAFYAS